MSIPVARGWDYTSYSGSYGLLTIETGHGKESRIMSAAEFRDWLVANRYFATLKRYGEQDFALPADYLDFEI